ncbi:MULTISPECIES: EamA family transporter [Streptomyces]|uniref:EamA family transporter n=1 Tax=Streptomyces lycopersici TaxID=2974589 RepID=UPI0021CF2E7A|nr:EamA family transporter [Streptomyces sp. NEAU-383]
MTRHTTEVVSGGAGGVRHGNLPRTALTALAPSVWGTTYVVTTELLPEGHPLFAGFLRALPAGLIALALTRTLPRGAWWGKAAALGVLNIGLFLPLLFVAAERLPGGVAATLAAAQPLVVAVLAVTVLHERLSLWRLLWGVTGVVGVGLVVIGPNAALDTVGVVAGLAGAVTMALGVTLTKRWGRPAGVGATAFAGWQLTAGGLFLLPLTFLAEGAPPAIDLPAALGYLWLGLVGGLITYALWFQGITSLPVASVAVLALLSPLVAAVLGAIVLDQTLGPVQLVGFALSLAAIVAGQLPPRASARIRARARVRTSERDSVSAPAPAPAPAPEGTSR